MFISVFPFPCVRIKKPRLGYQSGLFESDGSLVFRRAAILVVRFVKMLWAALALAKIKAKTKPPKKHNSYCRHRLLAEGLQNIQLTDRLCRLHDH